MTRKTSSCIECSKIALFKFVDIFSACKKSLYKFVTMWERKYINALLCKYM